MYDQNDRNNRNDRDNINNRNDLNNRDDKSNGLIYFVVGALIIAVIGIGFLSTQDSGDADGYAVMEPAAGNEGDTSEFEFNANEDGFEAYGSDREIDRNTDRNMDRERYRE